MRKCACGSWSYKTERGQARVTYAELVEVHNHHIAEIITTRLLDYGGIPQEKFLARSESAQTGKASPSNQGPDAGAPIVRAGESSAVSDGTEKENVSEKTGLSAGAVHKIAP